jgi:hypothetical protein
MRCILMLVVALTGCSSGAGAFAGYGMKRGVVYGAEGGAGLAVAQVAAGIQNQDRFRYFRIDATGNTAMWKHEGDVGVGGRFGIGYGRGQTHRGGVFAIGGNGGYNFRDHHCTDHYGMVGLLGMELRYAGGELQFVANARIEATADNLCLR